MRTLWQWGIKKIDIFIAWLYKYIVSMIMNYLLKYKIILALY